MQSPGYLTGVIGGFLLSALIAGAAFYLRSDERAFRERAAASTATVVLHDQNERRDTKGKRRVERFDVYEYTTQTGERVRFIQPNSATRPRRPIGTNVPVLYDPSDPNDARLDDDALSRTSTLLFLASPFGLVIAAIFLVVWRKTNRSVSLA